MDKSHDFWQSQPIRIRIAAGGRIVIPSEVRHALGVGEGDEVLLTHGENGVRLTTVEHVVKEAQAYFRRLKTPGESVVDELLRERRDEVAQEECEPRQGRERNRQ